MIETRLLHYFLAIAREQNITRAAEQLHVTQPTLSKQMMDHEQQLGKQLFVRGKRSVTLTEDGRFLRAKAQDILDIMENTESAFRSQSGLIGGDITIGCGETSAMEFITEVFRSVHERYPDIRLHTHSGDADTVIERLEKGLADIGLLIGPVKNERFDYYDIDRRDVFGLLVPSGCKLSERRYIDICELERLPLIVSEQTLAGHHDSGAFKIDRAKMNIVATYNLIYNATFLVEKGIGYALCLTDLVNTANRDLAFVPIRPEISLPLSIVTKRYQTFSPAVKVFLDELKAMTEDNAV